MKETEILLLICTGLLLLTAAVLFVRLHSYKKQIRSFTDRIAERKEADMNQLVTVDCFEKNLIGLAKILNEYTDMVKANVLSLENDRHQLKSVIAGISHDFRTPLTSVKGYMQLVSKSGMLDQKNQEYLDIALEKTNYLKSLSDTFFEVSAIEANDEPACLENVNLTNLLSEKILGQYEWIKDSGLKTDFDIPEKDIIVCSNEGFLNRIIENLFSNARKYAVSRFAISLAGENGTAVLVFRNDVENAGELETNKVFDAFYRDAARHNEGSGLGLYVVKCLAEKLGHKVYARVDQDMFGVYLELLPQGEITDGKA